MAEERAPTDAPDRASRHHAISRSIQAGWAREGYNQLGHLEAMQAQGDRLVIRAFVHSEHDAHRAGRSLGAWLAARDLIEIWGLTR